MNKVEVSIILPIYNAEKYLAECFESALNQIVEVPYEVIAVLNPCTDRSSEIVSEYSQKYANLKVINMDVLSGPGICRSRGIAEARGRYICFLDADDKYHPDFLKRLYEEAEKGNDIVNCNFFSYKNGKATKTPFASNKKRNSVQSVKALDRKSVV